MLDCLSANLLRLFADESEDGVGKVEEAMVWLSLFLLPGRGRDPRTMRFSLSEEEDGEGVVVVSGGSSFT